MSVDTLKSSQPDVLTVALIIAAAAHAIVILGVSFQPFLDEMQTPPALEVILVKPNDDSAPEDASLLAQFSQDGGGDTDENTRPSSPFSSELEVENDGIAPTAILASSPRPLDSAADEVITGAFAVDEIAVEQTQEITDDIDAPEGTILVEQNVDIAKLAAEIERQQERFAKRPKKKHVNARTRESASAEYMYRWVERVERFGNLNYPDDARRDGLYGALILIVGIYKNGEIESITIDKSSGYELLDNAAVNIVRMAAPFDPMTGKLADETDILYIVRTWEFNSNNSVTSY